MRYLMYQQGEIITLEGLKYYLRIVDDTHDFELAALLRNATIYVQEYFNTSLATCSVLQEQPQVDTTYKLFLNNRSNIRVTDYDGNGVDFEVAGNTLTISKAQPVLITYDCEPSGEIDGYALIVYQIAGANYDGQPEQIANILRNHPVL